MSRYKEQVIPINSYPMGMSKHKFVDDTHEKVILKFTKEAFMTMVDLYLNSINDYHVYELSKKGRYYANVEISFDTETTSVRIGEDINNTKPFAFVYIWQIAIGRYVFYGREIHEMIDAVAILSKLFNTDIDHRIIIWIHNIAYDFNFFRLYFKWAEMVLMDKHKPLYCCTDEGIEFRCTYLLSGKSLEAVANSSIEKIFEKKVGDLDYDVIRTSNTELTEEELGYCVNDVLTMNQYLYEIRTYNTLGLKIRSMGDIPYTKTGVVREYFRNLTIYSKYDKVKNEYREMIKTLKLTVDEYMMCSRCFQGGFTHGNFRYVDKVVNDVGSADISSSYPAVMVRKKFPMTQGVLFEFPTIEEVKELLKTGVAMMEIICEDIKPKDNCPDHYIMDYKAMNTKNLKLDNGRVVEGDMLSYFVTNLDLEIILDLYEIKRLRIAKMYYYKADYLPLPFVEGVLDLYAKKQVLNKDDIEYGLSKELLNSSYGMSAQDPIRPEYSYDMDTDAFTVQRADLEKSVEDYNTNKGRFLYYPWAVFITAYARYELFKMIKKMGKDHYLYADTDSNKIRLFEGAGDIIDKANEEIINEMKKVAAERGFSEERFCPKNRDGEHQWIGTWDKENWIGNSKVKDQQYKRFKTLGAKRYLVELQDGHIKPTIAGWNKKKAEEFFNKSKNPFDAFDIGLTIPAQESGKTTSYYSSYNGDDLIEAVVVGDDGIPCLQQQETWVHISPIEFSLSRSDDFWAYLNKI